jgi:hypothetical protein
LSTGVVGGGGTGGTVVVSWAVSTEGLRLQPAMRSNPSNTTWTAKMAKTVKGTGDFALVAKVP